MRTETGKRVADLAKKIRDAVREITAGVEPEELGAVFLTLAAEEHVDRIVEILRGRGVAVYAQNVPNARRELFNAWQQVTSQFADMHGVAVDPVSLGGRDKPTELG